MTTATMPVIDRSGALPIVHRRVATGCDRTLATVLFTDIVGSTGHALMLGDRRWRAVLDAYDLCVATALTDHRGHLVKSTGDGSLALFAVAGGAIRCARAIADRVTELGLTLRCGLHCGEVEIRGADVAGIAVTIAQRVQSWAEPGEVLVSRTVADVVAGDDVVLVDRGEQPLKGLPGTWRLYAAG